MQSQSHDELDLAVPVDSIELSDGNLRGIARRHTLTSQFSPYGFSTPTIPAQRFSHRRQGSFQAHQPQRSLTSSGILPASSPQSPALLRPRRPSFSSDIAPLQHASMVGSYEESILRGRMSTSPSRPLEFVAQIGVLGIGKCKSSLRCPPHVTLPFPAVFYSYGKSIHGRHNLHDGPSPYVGQIDLENGLRNPDEEQRLKRKLTSRRVELKAQGNDDVSTGDVRRESMAEASDAECKRSHRPRRRSGSPKCPPGGSYRIPEKGQIQIVIKNQNKTAVKLFLVPYDLSDMEPGTKTFIRQRSYSAGPIIDNAPQSETEKPTLRYLVHLHMCCPSRGRYYLYKSIRVVFANRVPDGKEKLRNEVTHPEPRFSPYKAVRVMNPPPLSSLVGPATGSALAVEKAFRRRSSGSSLGKSHFNGPGQSFQKVFASDGILGPSSRIDPISFKLASDLPARDDSNAMGRMLSFPLTRRRDFNNSQLMPDGWESPDSAVQSYDEPSKGDLDYGGNAFIHPAPSGSSGAEGLLSKRLKSLEMQQRQGMKVEPAKAHENGQVFKGGKQDPADSR